MRIERTTDADLVRSVVTHPEIYPFISDDHSPAVEDYAPPVADGIYWLACYSGNALAGLFMAHPWNGITYEIHTCILPAFRGVRAREATAAVLAWIFSNTNCLKLVTHVPVWNEAAFRLATASGMKPEGINRQSFMKNQIIHDQTLLGITRTEWKQCQ